jgi:hypothetical protein
MMVDGEEKNLQGGGGFISKYCVGFAGRDGGKSLRI